jgi:hypothetical protein
LHAVDKETAMPPRTAPQRRPSPDVLPDSLPRRGQEPDVLPDDARRRDQPDLTPDSLPPARESDLTDTRPDGGVAEHPIHDEDQEDLEPDDYEREVDEIAARNTERRAADEELGGADEFTTEELGPRSIPSEDNG